MTIAMSGMMRLGGTVYNLDKAFDGVGGCNSFVAARGKGQELSKGNNCGNAVLFEIKKFLQEMGVAPAKRAIPLIVKERFKETPINPRVIAKITISSTPCPECGEPLGPNAHEGGCVSCKSCGYSRC